MGAEEKSLYLTEQTPIRISEMTAQLPRNRTEQLPFSADTETQPLQLEFDPKITVEQGGVEIVTQLVLSHFNNGGTLININILDGEKLMEAHKDPTLHPDLVVRVTGFTAYFASLSPDFRELVVKRFLEGM